MNNEIYKTLRETNVTEHVDQKNGLNYLSWAWAVDELMKKYPEAQYEVERFDGKPYLYDPLTGYMVFTRIRIRDIEHEMWLPVMDEKNKAMLDHQYTYTVATWEYNKETKKREKIGTEEKTVEPATMYEINKTIMRCLVKNMAMFGLGISIYADEDLPEAEITEEELLKRAKAYKFAGTKHPGQTIEEVYKIGDTGYLQYWLDQPNGNAEVKKYITMVTGMKSKEVPDTEAEQKERLILIGEIQDLANQTGTDLADVHKFYKHEGGLEYYTTAELKNCKRQLTDKKKKIEGDK